MAFPTDWNPPHYADGAGAGTTTFPGDTRLSHGHDPADPLPAESWNWYIQTIAEWLEAVKGSQVFTAPDTAIAAMVDSVTGLPIYECCVVDEHDLDHEPGTIHTDTNTGQSVLSVACSGSFVAFAELAQGAGYAVERDTTTAVATYTLTQGAATFDVYSRIITNGTYTVVCHHTYVECFDALTGVQAWFYDHGAQVYDIAMDGTRVYLVGEDGGAGFRHVEAVTLSTGVQAWFYRHTATGGDQVNAVATNGKQVFIAGNASSYGSGATLRALVASNGYDAANEGGTGADTTGVAWDDVQATEQGYGMVLATDGESLWCGYDATAARQVERRGCADGSILADAEIAGGNVVCLAVDQRYLYTTNTAADDGTVCFDKRTLSRVWRWLDPAGGGVNAVSSDGFAVFIGCDTAARRLTRLYRGNRATRCRLCDPSDDFLPLRLLLVPQE